MRLQVVGTLNEQDLNELNTFGFRQPGTARGINAQCRRSVELAAAQPFRWHRDSPGFGAPSTATARPQLRSFSSSSRVATNSCTVLT